MDEGLISLKSEKIHSSKEAIMEAGKLLLKNGNIEENYIDKMIESYEKNGAYIVIAPRIAMPHASHKDGVIKAGFSILTLKEPVVFGNKENDPVDVIIGLATGSNDEHIEIIKKITKIFTNNKKVEIIFNATDKKDVIKLFEEE